MISNGGVSGKKLTIVARIANFSSVLLASFRDCASFPNGGLISKDLDIMEVTSLRIRLDITPSLVGYLPDLIS
jgi:hypothetical protein